MRSHLLSLLMLACFALCLAGCGGSDTPKPDPVEQKKNEDMMSKYKKK